MANSEWKKTKGDFDPTIINIMLLCYFSPSLSDGFKTKLGVELPRLLSHMIVLVQRAKLIKGIVGAKIVSGGYI